MDCLSWNRPCRNTGSDLSIHGGKSTLQDLMINGSDTRIRSLGGSSAVTAQLKLNGHDRFSARHDNYFTRTQVWQHHHGAHTGGGGGAPSGTSGAGSTGGSGIVVIRYAV